MNASMTSPFSLKGERALITGGTSGLGLAMTRCFLEAGAEVIAVGRRPYEEGVKQLEGLGSGVHYRQFDVSETEKAESFVEEVTRSIGDITVLVNNAGNHLKKPADETTTEEFMNVLQVHVLGAFALSRAVIKKMKQKRKGSIIFQASMSSYIGLPNVIAYSTAKSAYLGMIRSLASEVSGYGIRVNGIAPGWIETPMLEQALSGDPERKARILQRTPFGTFGKPEDIGWASVYLASPAAKFVNGIVLPVDGGALIGF